MFLYIPLLRSGRSVILLSWRPKSSLKMWNSLNIHLISSATNYDTPNQRELSLPLPILPGHCVFNKLDLSPNLQVNKPELEQQSGEESTRTTFAEPGTTDERVLQCRELV